MSTETKTEALKPADITVTVSANYLRALYPFMAKDDIRYYLMGIHVRPHHECGVIIEAACGHTAGVIHDRDGKCNAATILKIDAAMMTKIRRDDDYVVANDRGALVREGVEVFITPGAALIEGRFPDIPKLLSGKTFAPGMFGAANFDYIDRCKLKPLTKMPGLKFWQQHTPSELPGDGVIVVRNEMVPEFMGLVMPMRAEGIPDAVPAWFGVKADGQK